MCEQCVAKTDLYRGPDKDEVLPGWYLIRATQDGDFLKKDDWCLVKINDPDFWWQVTPVEDPDWGLTDEQIDALPPDDKRYEAFDKAAENLEEALNGATEDMQNLGESYSKYYHLPRFEDAGLLWEAARQAGYDPKVHGYRFAFWLCHYLAVFLKTAKIEKQEEQESIPDDNTASAV